ncbi:MAG: hypothetical protein HUU54_00590 [Ignavibacteriaceae bacterium]|nr:hypothetical protein [Ignavibacteriaceae bacterium]
MNLRQLVGQMLMPGFSANFNNESHETFKRVKRLVQKFSAGGFVIFQGSLVNYQWVTRKLQGMTGIPLLFAADFERGLAMRIEGMTQFPHNMALGSVNDINLARKFARIVAREGLEIGVHQNYAPVLDLQEVNDNPIVNIRSFSREPAIVSHMGKAFVDGYRKERAIATAKHFPGHGATDTDSHRDIPVIAKSTEKIFSEDLLPFINAIRAGVHSVMVGHLVVPALDPSNLPATLSPRIVTGVLRDELKFDGLIVTDAMNMQAICNYHSIKEATIMTVKAGTDIVLVSGDDEISFNSLYEAVRSGEISLSRIKESVIRILSAKHWLGLYQMKTAKKDIAGTVNSREAERISEEIASRALKIKNTSVSLTLPESGKMGCIGISDKVEGQQEIYFHELINNHFNSDFNFVVNNRWHLSEFERVRQEIDNSATLILPVFLRIRSYQGKLKLTALQQAVIEYVINSGKNYIIIAFGDPYYLSGIKGIKNLVLTYSDSYYSQNAVINFLKGKLSIQEIK